MLIPKTEVIVTKGGQQCARYVVEPGDYVIGREPGCEIVVDADLVSRRHAQLTVNYSEWLIEDLQSSNGTLVNGNAVTECVKVWPNQKIQVGSATIELRRVKEQSSGDHSIAPSAATLKRVLPEEFLRDKKYDIGGIVAQGGMGAILNAKEATTERTVAMKVMLNGNSEDDMLRFIGEAKITAQLEHPNVVPLHELGIDEQEQPFYTMKFVKGVTLRSVLEKIRDGDAGTLKAYPLTLLLTIFQKVCDALAFAHSKGIVHRDLKPENVMIGDYGEVLVMDWGLAKVLGKADPNSMARSAVMTAVHDAPDASHTMAGTIMGTPNFMAPEQAAGDVDKIDARTDIFSLGGILYNILTLRPPFTGESVNEVLEKVVEARITSPTAFNKKALIETSDGKKIRPIHCPGSNIPEALSAVTMKALALKPLDRYQNVQALQKDITAYQTGFATSAENAGLVKQVTLLVKRHKAIFSTGFAAWLIITALAVWFVLNLRASEARATTALDNLRKTAPTYFDQAKLLVEREQLQEALDKINVALALNSMNASFHVERGNILQSMERFSEAAFEYGKATNLNSGDSTSVANLELSHWLLEEKAKNGALSVEARTKWRDALAQQGRDSEAIMAGATLQEDNTRMLKSWQAKIDAWLGKGAPRIDKSFRLDLTGRSITNLAPLRGMPIKNLLLNDNPHIRDLSPLELAPLESLNLMGASDLTDLAPLKGKMLRSLNISATGVTHLEALTGITSLEFLNCGYTKIANLNPLNASHLITLEVQSSLVDSLIAVRGQPLQRLDIGNTGITNLDPVRKAELQRFKADRCHLHSLEPLRDQPIRELAVNHTMIDDGGIEPIATAPLETLQIENCAEVDLSIIKSRQLQVFAAYGTIVTHQEILGEMRALEVITLPKNMADLTIIRKLPKLRKIDTTSLPGGGVDNLKDAVIFWREYDAQQAAQKK